MSKTAEPKLHKSNIDLGDNVRGQMVGLLNQSLASAIDLMLRTKEAHWNVRGANFIALHKFFDELNTVMIEHVDTIAERITSIGGQAEGRLPQVNERSQMPEYPVATKAEDHLNTLAKSFATLGKECRANIDKADDAGDADTADMYTAISRDLDKYLWMIEAHINA